MRRRIIENVPPHELDREIKRGPGGLRDIEFAVQLLQLVHGRADETLRVAGHAAGAARAGRAAATSAAPTARRCCAAYRFLRDRRAPAAAAAAAAYAHRARPTRPRCAGWPPRSGYTRRCPAATPSSRSAPTGSRHASEVRRLHVKLLYRPLLEAVARVPAEALRMTPEAARHRLEVLGFADPAGALRHLEALTGGVSRTAAIQRTLLPVLLQEFADAPEPDRGPARLPAGLRQARQHALVPAAAARRGSGGARLARVLGLSRYVTDLLARDPEALRLLADDAELRAAPGATSLRDGFIAAAEPARRPGRGDPARSARCAGASCSGIACADVLSRAVDSPRPQPIDVTAVGIGAVRRHRRDAGRRAAGRAAAPSRSRKGCASRSSAWAGSAGDEMSYPSDADVLFVYDPPPGVADDAASAAAHAVAEELRRLLGMPAPDPPLGVDADLRPEGRQGPLVRSLAAYAAVLRPLVEGVGGAGAAARPVRRRRRRTWASGSLALADPVRYPAAG